MRFQKLPLADHFFVDIETGEKVRTLRWNEPEIIEGFLLFHGSNNPKLQAIVFSNKVSYGDANKMAPLYNMTPEELIVGMNKHYENVPPDATFMLIEHLSPKESRKVRGYKSFKTLSAMPS